MVINRNKMKKICALILLAVSIFLIGACCSLSVQAKESDAETAYQEFLEGRRVLCLDEEALEALKEISILTHCENGTLSMKELIREINAEYYEDYEDSRGNNRIAGIEYAYLDCGQDGIPELAVRFKTQNFHLVQLILIITYKEGALYLRQAKEAWDRNDVLLNRYGYLWETGYNSTAETIKNESLIDGNGKALNIVENHIYWSDICEPEICQQVYGSKEYFLEQNHFQINDEKYRCFLNQDGEDPSDDNFAQFKKLYEQKHGKLYTKAEIDQLLDGQRKELGITEEMLAEKEPDWKPVETAGFKDLVRNIGLKEVYDRIESGDWSDVQNFGESQTPIITKNVSWVRKDLNYDEIPELLCLNVSGAVGSRMHILTAEVMEAVNLP